jgi:thiol-disulfide isomerase/thioredoxin
MPQTSPCSRYGTEFAKQGNISQIIVTGLHLIQMKNHPFVHSCWSGLGSGFAYLFQPEGSAVRRNKKFHAFLALMAAFALMAVVGCGSEKDGSAEAEQKTAAAQPTAAPGSKGSVAPDFSLKRLDGGDLQLSSLRGKAVIIDFWDTWCGPCRVSMPHFLALSQEYSDDLVVVGVALGREGEDKVRKFAQDRGLTFEMVLFNNDPALIQGFGGIQSIPTTFLVDGEGIIREVWIGGHGKAEYERGVKAVIGS